MVLHCIGAQVSCLKTWLLAFHGEAFTAYLEHGQDERIHVCRDKCKGLLERLSLIAARVYHHARDDLQYTDILWVPTNYCPDITRRGGKNRIENEESRK